MIDLFKSCFISDSATWNAILAIIVIILAVYGMYTNIKYACLKKATEKVAEVEKLTELTGEQKFATVVLWIENDIPKIFANEFVKSIIKKLVQLAYDNSSEFAKNYIKRKTGYDVSDLIKNLALTSRGKPKDTKSDQSTSN